MALDIRYEYPDCDHKQCKCALIVKAKDKTFGDFECVSKAATKELQLAEVCAYIAANFSVSGSNIFRYTSDVDRKYLEMKMLKEYNIKMIRPPIDSRQYPEPITLIDPPRGLRAILKRVDKMNLARVLGRPRSKIDFEAIWKDDKEGEVPPMEVAIMRKFSAYHMVYGRVNGRPFMVSAQGDLYPFKHMNTILGYNRHTHKCLAQAEQPLELLPVALDYMYRAMGINEFGKELSEINFKDLNQTYLGSSSGIHPGYKEECKVESGEKLLISPNGKKVENFEADLQAILKFLCWDEEFEVFYSISPKNEIYFNQEKCLSREKFAEFAQKARVFVIPTSTFMLAEKLVSKMRMMKERGMIRIGQKWVYGGAWKLAKVLGIDLTNCWLPLMVEGDVKKFDQTVQAIFVRLYMSTMLVHEDPNSPDYPAKKKLVEFLAKKLATRVTRIYGDLWGIHKGGVPSGCFNTSHMDSWIMGLYFFLFGAYQVASCPEEDREEVERAVLAILLVVYGDDHLYNKGIGKGAIYLSGSNFAHFMKNFSMWIFVMCLMAFHS